MIVLKIELCSFILEFDRSEEYPLTSCVKSTLVLQWQRSGKSQPLVFLVVVSQLVGGITTKSNDF